MTLAGSASIAAWAVLGVVLAGLAYGAAYTAWAERRWLHEGRMLKTGLGSIHVVEAGAQSGARPAVVLVHGASANSREIRSGLEAPLAEAGFRVIAMDRPGFGGTPAFKGRDRLGGHARALAALIEAEGLERPIVIGHSYGGAVALRLALDRPGLAAGYVLVGPATHGDVGPVAWYNHVGAAPGIGWAFCRIVVPIAGPLMAPGGLEGTFAPRPTPRGHSEATGVGLVFRPRTFAANARDLARANPELRAQQIRYGEIDAPVAIVSGAEDRTVFTARHSERAAAALPDARLSVLPGVGHMPHHAAPELIVEHVLAIAEALETSSRAEAAS